MPFITGKRIAPILFLFELEEEEGEEAAAKREAEKAAKAEAEQERLATLARHKRELERARMAEQAKTSKNTTGGGMSAYVDENGKLVWQ